MIKNYNSNRSKLLLPEYGRNILQMVEALREIPDRGTRNEQARVVIDVMGNINPTLRDSSDYKHKLWDHLFLIADFDLDIDSPYPIPSRDSLTIVPEKIAYPQHDFSHKQYGRNIRQVIDAISEVEDEELINAAMADVAKFMKIKSYEFNKEFPSDEVILNDIRKFTDNEIHINDDMLNGTKIAYNRASKLNKKNTRSNNNNNSKTQNNKFQSNRNNQKRRPMK